MKQHKFWLRLIGTAVLLHVILILLSIIEVAIYSYLISPGKDQAFYAAHASVTGPWISAIGGSVLMFFLVRRFCKRFSLQQFTYAVGLPATYLAIDLILILASGYDFTDFADEVLAAGIAKIMAAALAYFLYRDKTTVSH